MSKLLKIFLLIFLVLAAATVAFFYSYRQAIERPMSDSYKEVNFKVSKGEKLTDISRRLESAGLIRSNLFFEIFSKRAKLSSQFQAGEYILSPSLSARRIALKLAKGEIKNSEKDIKIIEGWNINEIDKYLAENNFVVAGDFAAVARKAAYKFANGRDERLFLQDAPAGASLEGYLYPDTYRVYADASIELIIAKMLDNFDGKLTPELRNEINTQKKTIFQIVTMASLLEKEVKIDASGHSGNKDAQIVSGIFWKRLADGRRLESCATLAYILGVNKAQYSLADTQIDSPYNTYRNSGLPPGPIANPGIEAIKAAVYPVATDYNFFLNNPQTGQAVFSRTYEEHLKNKEKYLN